VCRKLGDLFLVHNGEGGIVCVKGNICILVFQLVYQSETDQIRSTDRFVSGLCYIAVSIAGSLVSKDWERIWKETVAVSVRY
jgi:hypothetical protein